MSFFQTIKAIEVSLGYVVEQSFLTESIHNHKNFSKLHPPSSISPQGPSYKRHEQLSYQTYPKSGVCGQADLARGKYNTTSGGSPSYYLSFAILGVKLDQLATLVRGYLQAWALFSTYMELIRIN